MVGAWRRELQPARLLQRLDGEGVRQGGGRDLLVALAKGFVIEPQAWRKKAHDLAMGLGLAPWSHGRVVDRQIVMATGAHDIEMLELGGRRQHDVGMESAV